jgi:hypothetical protein
MEGPARRAASRRRRRASNGVPITDVSRWLGRRSVDTTARVYAPFLPDSFERGRDVLDAEFEELD